MQRFRGFPRWIVLVAALGFLAACVGEPGAVASPSLTPVGESPSLSPSPTASLTVSPVRQGTWTSMHWSAPSPLPDGAVFWDVVAWRDGYVAVGQAPSAEVSVGAAFFSVDGLRWERTTEDSTFTGIPGRIVATGTRLVAFGSRSERPESLEAWSSVDGRIWQRQESLALVGAGVVGIAARDRTMVAAGTDPTGRTMMWRSVDGAAWSRTQSPSGHAVVRSVIAVADGFLALGREGQTDTASGGVGVRGVGMPAAWWSGDGQIWSAVHVDGVEAPGAELSGIFRVADGFVAIGSDNAASQRAPLLWSSTDGRDWRLIGPPAHWGFASANGTQAVILAFGGVGADPEGWTSFDGREWTRLEFTGDVNHIPVTQQFVGMSGHIDRVFLMPRGVLVIGQVIADQRGMPAVWFAEAVTR